MKQTRGIIRIGIIFLLLCSLAPVFAEPCGDVNSDGTINIVDALMTAQYCVGLNPPGFDPGAADVDGDGAITIVDALQIAQYYVGIIPVLPGCTECTLTLTASPPGSGKFIIEPGPPYHCGNEVTITATGETCWEFNSWSGGASGTTNPLTITINENTSITGNFDLLQYTITAAAGPGGSISPQGSIPVNCGDDQNFIIAPDHCYEIANVVVDGVFQDPVSSYTFSDVRENHNISVSFKRIQYTITATASPYGRISDPGSVPIDCGGTRTYLFQANSSCIIVDVIVDGFHLDPLPSSYEFVDVQKNHSIHVVFMPVGGYFISYALADGSDAECECEVVSGPARVYYGQTIDVSVTTYSCGTTCTPYGWDADPRSNVSGLDFGTWSPSVSARIWGDVTISAQMER